MHRSSGKVSATLIIILAFVAGLVVMALTTGGETPMAVGGKFMSALAAGDAAKLAALSHAEGVSQEELEEQWRYTMDVAAPHFKFTYAIKGESITTDRDAIVWMMYAKDAGSSSAYEERFELPLVKTDEGWRVDVYSLNRDMFPGLPRAH
jgi:hypothetical protein